MKRRLVLERPTRVPDGAGGFAEGWQELGMIWAELQPGAGREVAKLEARLAQVHWRITLRGAPIGAARRPVAGQRFREGTRVFLIHAVAEADPVGAYLTCFATEEVRL